MTSSLMMNNNNNNNSSSGGGGGDPSLTKKKRSHDAMSAAREASSELMSSLSSSLHQMLLQPTTTTASKKKWLEEAANDCGVSSNVSALKLWTEHGRENDEEFCNVRYLVWVCKDVLNFGHNEEGKGENTPTKSSLLEVLQSWQRGMEALIVTNDNNFNSAENHDDDDGELGVMWQMLLHSLHITPNQLSSLYPQFVEESDNNIDDISNCFLWPSFFKWVVNEAASRGRRSENDENGNKRRKLDGDDNIFSSSSSRRMQQQKSSTTTKATTQLQSNLTNTAWWPLLGYSITHAIAINHTATTTIQSNKKLHIYNP